jgi:hypothetical protein
MLMYIKHHIVDSKLKYNSPSSDMSIVIVPKHDEHKIINNLNKFDIKSNNNKTYPNIRYSFRKV